MWHFLLSAIDHIESTKPNIAINLVFTKAGKYICENFMNCLIKIVSMNGYLK